MDYYTFYAGTAFDLWKDMGAHVTTDGTTFTVYAPNARSVSLIGEFNNWKPAEMERSGDGRFYTLHVKEAHHFQMYKYRITGADGKVVDHSDPFAFYSELRPGTASRIYDMNRYAFHDEAWMKKRNRYFDKPLNIYEMHMGSWKKKDEHNPAWWYNYREVADMLVPYLLENGYNAVEIMPLSEYPDDASWGYQATGFYAITSRYGEPDDLRYFIDICHRNNISVILDFITVHFAINFDGLAMFDGTPLYEYPNSAVQNSEWGSCNFMHSRPEVRCYLQSAIDFLLTAYHFDGIRFDAVGNLIYWQGNKERGVNTNAIDFARKMNEGLHKRHPDVTLMAEDSSAYPGVTSSDGLAFDYKWDLGWMNDTLRYFALPFEERSRNYHALTFRATYAHNEKYILPLSHDENVHGKKTIVEKMYGDYETRFQQARMLYMYMYALPGKKLDFMGNEFAMIREWNEKQSQDFNLLSYPIHDAFYHFRKDLHHLYLSCSSLYAWDYEEKGFQWVECDNAADNIYAFRRFSANETTVFIMNCSDKPHSFFWSSTAHIRLLLDSGDQKYGGSNNSAKENAHSVNGKVHIILPPLSARIYLEY